MGAHFKAGGVIRLQGDLSEAGPRNTARASRALRKAAHDIEGDAKQFAPVDTGALKNSISSDVEAFHSETGPTVEYGHYVENGTSRMGPQPYMAPAAERQIPAFHRALRDIIGDIL